MEKSPRKVHDEKTICAPNNYFYVTEKHISSEKCKNFKANVIYFRPGAHILLLDQHDNVYLNREYRLAVDEFSIECPGGAIEDGEEPLQAAQRELREEAGIVAKDRKFLGVMHPVKGFIVVNAHIFMARLEKIVENKLDEVEHIQRLKVSLKEAYGRVEKQRINDPITCCLIQKAYIERLLSN